MSTRNIVRRKNMTLHCHLIIVRYVTMYLRKQRDHLFFQCLLALNCLNLLNIQPILSNSVFDIMESLKSQINSSIFMSLIVSICWIIWMARNDLDFQGIQPSVVRCRNNEKNSLCLCIEYEPITNLL